MEPSPSTLWRLVGEALAVIFRAAPGFEARLTPHASLALSGEPSADLNCAVIDQGSDPEATLREFMGRIQERDVPATVFLTEAVDEPLAAPATELGLELVSRMPLMLRGSESLGDTSGRFAVKRVASAAELSEAVGLASAAFTLPPEVVASAFPPELLDGPGLDYFLARDDDGNAISSGATTRHGRNVGIWIMATAPDHQRKGAGGALLNYALGYHLDLAATHFFLGATEAGQPLYERVGFRTVAPAAIWVRGHSTQVPTKDDG